MTESPGPGSTLLVGCGRMGQALATGWRTFGNVYAFDPGGCPVDNVREIGRLADVRDLAPRVIVLAVKPAILMEVASQLRPYADGRLFISVAAGVNLSSLARMLGSDANIVRAMPNTPAAVMSGITACVAAPDVGAEDRLHATRLLSAVGEVVWLDDEAQMDAVTALSGSGPAYFFRFAEALAEAGIAEGLPPEIARRLARATFEGAGRLAVSRTDTLQTLRQEVTSPAGTTAAALECFDRDGSVDRLVREAVSAAATRSRELAQ